MIPSLRNEDWVNHFQADAAAYHDVIYRLITAHTEALQRVIRAETELENLKTEIKKRDLGISKTTVTLAGYAK